MNAERLRDVADTVLRDSKNDKLVQLLTALQNSYTQSVQSPSSETAEAFTSSKQALDDAILDGECVRLSPSRIAILERIGGKDLCGTGLLEKVNSILASPVTPASAVEALSELRTEATDFYATIATLRDSLDELAIKGERPPSDAAEVEVRIPFDLFSGSLGGFAKEAKSLDRALSDIVESVSGSRPPIAIRTLAGGSVEVFVTVDPVSGVVILTLVTAIVNLINSVLQTRKTRLDLEKDRAPKEVLDPLEKWEQSRVAEELNKLRKEVLAKSKADRGRKNELKNALTVSLQYLADRIDRGMDIEVATLLDASSETESSANDGENVDAKVVAQRQIVEAMNSRRRLLRADKPVLSLPPIPDDEEDGPDGQARAKP